ncbi:uncharacterized protein LOC117647091 [Thrips palmi]|uniref:Uncharacterized protein LOC117647091 n=1 Tax=Thrips palmi TaxID=161013 RepID=A0A6P8ZAX8_THRPL|nr:uncharacterized protein LOC117647091 [Thrips palmi]
MDMERMAFTALPAVLVMVYVMPILCTIEVLVLSNEAELFSYVTASHVLTLLLPMCMAGDLLSRLRNGVCNGAYNGPWTEVGAYLRNTPRRHVDVRRCDFYVCISCRHEFAH